MDADLIIRNVNLATMQENRSEPYGQINNGLLAVKDGQILWLGAEEAAPDFDNAVSVEGNGGWLTPGLVDCHTHLVYAGDRAREFEWRLQGASYEHIAQRGGGINSTVAATRAASADELLQSAGRRLRCLLREGVTCVEIKSGYGLNLETEARMLKIARTLERQFPVTVSTTFLGAHALPPEFKDRADDYIDYVCAQMLPAVAEQGLADAVDVFCEGIGFTTAQCKKVFTAAQKLGLPVKGHVEQLSYQGGGRMVAECAGLSADHLEYLPARDVSYLQRGKVVAVLLPGAFYFLNESQRPPIATMRTAGLPMAVATDLNPGSSPMASLLLAMNLACVLFGLTPEEALAGVTRHGARALGLESRKGQLKAGCDADLALWDIDHPAQLSYGINMNTPAKLWVGGQRV